MPKKILIIDDEPELVASLTALLESTGGVEVDSAYEPEVGLKKAQAWRPDVVLMDIYMPNVDGWEATRRLKQEPTTKGIPVVIMTAVLSKALLEQVRSVGAQRVITKPFEVRDIASLMNWLAERRDYDGVSPH